MNPYNPELQLTDTESAIRSKVTDLLSELIGFKFMIMLVLEFKKIESDDKIKYDTFYLNSKVETIVKESDIDNAFE